MELISIAYFIVAGLYLVHYLRKYGWSPVSVFLIIQIVMFSGLFTDWRITRSYGQKLLLMYPIALATFIGGVEFHNLVRGYSFRFAEFFSASRADALRRRQDEALRVAEPVSPRQKKILLTVLVLGLALCVYMFASSGVNVFVESIKSFFSSGETETFALERQEFLSVSGVGYIYQFRAILLPMLAAFVMYGGEKLIRQPVLRYLYVAVVLVFLLGTGQRNAFMFFCLFLGLYYIITYARFRYRINKVQIVVIAVFAVAAMILLTITNNRTSAYSDNPILGAIYSLIDRIFGINSRTAISAMYYIDQQPTSWGHDWWMMLQDILPGKTDYLSVDRIVFYLAYGNYNGTGPPCIWGSAYYNFWWFGVTIFPFALGILYQELASVRIKMRQTALNYLIYAGITVFFGIWFCGSPVNLFNNGGVTVLLLGVLVGTFDYLKHEKTLGTVKKE